MANSEAPNIAGLKIVTDTVAMATKISGLVATLETRFLNSY